MSVIEMPEEPKGDRLWTLHREGYGDARLIHLEWLRIADPERKDAHWELSDDGDVHQTWPELLTNYGTVHTTHPELAALEGAPTPWATNSFGELLDANGASVRNRGRDFEGHNIALGEFIVRAVNELAERIATGDDSGGAA